MSFRSWWRRMTGVEALESRVAELEAALQASKEEQQGRNEELLAHIKAIDHAVRVAYSLIELRTGAASYGVVRTPSPVH